eukprot:3933237-Rhodomonas_salina.1
MLGRARRRLLIARRGAGVTAGRPARGSRAAAAGGRAAVRAAASGARARRRGRGRPRRAVG